MPLIQTPLMNKARVRLVRDIFRCFRQMAPDSKGRKSRLKKISMEKQRLWTEQLNLPITAYQTASAKLEKVLHFLGDCYRLGRAL